MRRRPASVPTLLLAVLAPLACTPVDSDEVAEGTAAAPADLTATTVQDLLDDLAEQTDVAEEKFLGLAEAIPEERYDWRPGEGVRSVREMFLHVAADNYFIPALMGVETPAESGITGEYASVQAYEARSATKAEIARDLEASFRFLDDALAETRGDLERSFTFGGTTFEVGPMWVQAVTHLHEHLGQAIAYARSNDVVPPWSQ